MRVNNANDGCRPFPSSSCSFRFVFTARTWINDKTWQTDFTDNIKGQWLFEKSQYRWSSASSIFFIYMVFFWWKHHYFFRDLFHKMSVEILHRHRFSAFWLRSKCSICSYQLNIWYDPHWGSTILNWFLNLGEDTGACSDFPTGWPGIAVPPGSAHSPWGSFQTKQK